MIERLHNGARMSQVVMFPGHATQIVLAGQVADDRGADTAGQTRDVLRKIDQLLDEAGAQKSDVTHATIWLKDIADFDAMNAIWDQWVRPGHAPARACVEANLAFPELRVEIQIFACKQA